MQSWKRISYFVFCHRIFAFLLFRLLISSVNKQKKNRRQNSFFILHNRRFRDKNFQFDCKTCREYFRAAFVNKVNALRIERSVEIYVMDLIDLTSVQAHKNYKRQIKGFSKDKWSWPGSWNCVQSHIYWKKFNFAHVYLSHNCES